MNELPSPIEMLQNIAFEKARRITAEREEILTAFVAKHGFEPDRAIQIEQRMPDGTSRWFVRRRTDDGLLTQVQNVRQSKL